MTRRIESKNENPPVVSYYPDKNYKIGFIIPVTSRKRNYKNIEEIDFFRILFTSFLTTVDKSGKYKYSFHLGYDDDDKFFSTNKEKIIEHFKSISIDFKDLELEIFLYEIKNLKSKVGEIWSKLADYASVDNDYLYQLGDDICLLSNGWEDRFVGKLVSQNNIGVVGPRDINNKKNILTQSFVHVTHLQIFTSYYPKKLKNWYTDNWIKDIYNASTENDIKVRNSGGVPRYDIEDDKKLFLEVLKETRPILEEYRESLKLEKLISIKIKKNLNLIFDDKRIVCSNRLTEYDFHIEEDLNIEEIKEFVNKNINYITEDSISNWVNNKKGFTMTRKYKNTSNTSSRYYCLTGYRDIIVNFCKNYLNKLLNPIILILIESDIIKIPSVILDHPMIEKIFTWNKEINHPKINCIPIGLNKDRHLENISDTPKNIEKEELVLINFNFNSNPCRKLLLKNNELMKISKNIKYVEPENIYHSKSFTDRNPKSFTDRKIKVEVTNKDFYKEMSKFKFVISPRGEGEDCHRTWEALYLGSIPIVLSSSINEIYEDLPVLIVNNWNEITEEFLNKKWKEFQEKEWNWSKIKIDYWFKKFEEKEDKVNFITYSNDVFSQAKKRLVKEAEDFYNFKSITSYGPEDLDDEFKEKYHDVLSQKRIGGYGIWRPYIIKKELEKVENNDFLIYCDAGCHLNPKGMKRFQEYLEILKKSDYGIISFQMPDQIEKWWTTKEIFNYFEVDINSEIGNSGQYLDGILIMKKNDHLIKIIDLWMKAVYDKPEIFTDKFNKINQDSFFKDNRHEQSVFSLIRKIHGSEIIPKDETWHPQPFGCEESLKYPIWAMRSKI